VFFESGDDFRAWPSGIIGETELLLGFYATKSESGITYQQALDHALCYGWIDGVRKNFDATSYTIRFTPRKAKSHWSQVNLKRWRELEAQGLTKPPALPHRAAARRQDDSVFVRTARGDAAPGVHQDVQGKPEGVGLLRGAGAVVSAARQVLGDDAKKEKRATGVSNYSRVLRSRPPPRGPRPGKALTRRAQRKSKRTRYSGMNPWPPFVVRAFRGSAFLSLTHTERAHRVDS
jgi:hypothetical protein